MALGSTQSLIEMSTGISLGGKSGGCLGLTTLSYSYGEPPEALRAYLDVYRHRFTLLLNLF